MRRLNFSYSEIKTMSANERDIFIRLYLEEMESIQRNKA